MKTLSVSEFKKHCTHVLRELPSTRETIVITSRSKPIAKVVPALERDRHPAWGALSGHVISISEDFDLPLGDEDWEAAE